MRVLLDTHALLWFLNADDRLSRHAHSIIVDPETEVLVSVASLWEIVIKASLERMDLAEPFEELIPAHLEAERIGVLQIGFPHLAALRQLPLHHRDPFDRLKIAQAIAEDMPILSRDGEFGPYSVNVIWDA